MKNGTNPEYQYSIADHQGNTRVVFSSAPVVVQAKTAGMEEVSNSDFQNYPTGGSRNSLSIYNHTTGGTYSQLLNGGNNLQIGLAKSYKVYPGDKVKIEAYGKYANPTSNSSNVSAFASALLNAFLLPVPVAGELGTASSALNSWGSVVAAGGDGQSNAAPHVSVNIILFDKNYNFLDAAYDQIAPGAQQVGVTPIIAHDYMTREYTVKEEGYVFMYIANENATQVDAYFDDVAMTYTQTNIVQYNEYYPFGLQTSTSWTRDNNSNNYLYNAGNELNATTGWYDLAYRNFDPSIGRFMQVDPLAHLDHSITPFAYAGNNPILFNDPYGDKVNYENGQMVGSQEWANAQYADAAAYNQGMAALWAQDSHRGGSGYGSSQAALAALITKAEGGDAFAAGVLHLMYGGGGGHWNPFGGAEIGRDEWIALGGDPEKSADHYYSGGWEHDQNSGGAEDGFWFDDKQGEILGMHWLNGSGIDLNFNDQEWGNYMRANQHLNDVLAEIIDNDLPTRTKSGSFSKSIFATTGVNDRRTGYGMLHGTQSFDIAMSVNVINATQLQYSAILIWSDRINPNARQGDSPWATVANWFYTPQDYNVRITWTQSFDVTRK